MNTVYIFLLGLIVGMVVLYGLLCFTRWAFFDKNEFDVDKPDAAQVVNPFKINYSNVLCPATTPTLTTCVTTYPSNCFETRDDADEFCGSSGECDITPFGTLTGTTYYASNHIDTSNLLNMYNETTLDVTTTTDTDDIFSVSNVTTLGACYIANKLKDISVNTECGTAQTNLKAEGINFSNENMNTMFTSCTLDATGELLNINDTIVTAPTFVDSGLETKCSSLGMEIV